MPKQISNITYKVCDISLAKGYRPKLRLVTKFRIHEFGIPNSPTQKKIYMIKINQLKLNKSAFSTINSIIFTDLRTQ